MSEEQINDKNEQLSSHSNPRFREYIRFLPQTQAVNAWLTMFLTCCLNAEAFERSFLMRKLQEEVSEMAWGFNKVDSHSRPSVKTQGTNMLVVDGLSSFSEALSVAVLAIQYLSTYTQNFNEVGSLLLQRMVEQRVRHSGVSLIDLLHGNHQAEAFGDLSELNKSAINELKFNTVDNLLRGQDSPEDGDV